MASGVRLVLVTAVLLAACSATYEAPPYGATGDRGAVLAAMDGFGDPLSAYLRGAITERGTLRGTYRDVLDGAGAAIGCDASSERSFVVLSSFDYVPKTLFTRCSSDAAAASRFFLALPAVDDTGDVAASVIH